MDYVFAPNPEKESTRCLIFVKSVEDQCQKCQHAPPKPPGTSRCNSISMADLQTKSSMPQTLPLLPLSFPPLGLFCCCKHVIAMYFSIFYQFWWTGKALWIHRHWTLIGLMGMVYLNYLPPSMRAAMFMSAALGKLHPLVLSFIGALICCRMQLHSRSLSAWHSHLSAVCSQ